MSVKGTRTTPQVFRQRVCSLSQGSLHHTEQQARLCSSGSWSRATTILSKACVSLHGVVSRVFGGSVNRICSGDQEPVSCLTGPLSLRFSISTQAPHLELPTSCPGKNPIGTNGFPGSWCLAHTQKWTVVILTSPRMKLWASHQAKWDGINT